MYATPPAHLPPNSSIWGEGSIYLPITQYSNKNSKGWWDSIAFLQQYQQKCCTVPIFLAKLTKMLDCPNLWVLTRRPHKLQKTGSFLCEKFGDTTAFLLSGIISSGQYSSFAGFVAVSWLGAQNLGTVQYFCWFCCKNGARSQNLWLGTNKLGTVPKIFVVGDHQIWVRSALLLVLLQECYTVPICFAKLAKPLDCPNLRGLW